MLHPGALDGVRRPSNFGSGVDDGCFHGVLISPWSIARTAASARRTGYLRLRSADTLCRELLALQQECVQLGPGWMAMGITLDSLNTAAFHFTPAVGFYFN